VSLDGAFVEFLNHRLLEESFQSLFFRAFTGDCGHESSRTGHHGHVL